MSTTAEGTGTGTGTALAPYKADFLRAALDGGALRFGSFALKSGRVSPYFFNAGAFYRADLLSAIATAYARAIISASSSSSSSSSSPDGGEGQQTLPEFDVIFGPAYKGIPLATATAMQLGALAPARFGRVEYAFDRKEAKDHGEGGGFVGAPLRGKRVLVVDDVVTAGTAKREAVAKIRSQGGEVVGVVVALDRMETLPSADEDKEGGKSGGGGGSRRSALGELRREFGVPILAILTLDDIIAGMRPFASADDIRRTEEYRQKYRAEDN